MSAVHVLRGIGLATLSGCMLFAIAASAESFVPIRTEDARATIGINTHVNYLDTSYANFPEVLNALKYIGVDHVRELSPMPWFSGAAPMGYYTELMKAGMNIDFVVPGSQVDLYKSLRPVMTLANESPKRISAIEGFNEVDHAPVTYKGQTGPDAAVAAQKDLYALVKGNPSLQHLPVYDLTGVMPLPETLSGRADFANSHLYPQNGYPPDGWFRGMKGLTDPNKLPMVVTEFGYASMPESGWLVVGVDEIGQAKGILSGIFSGIEHGFARTYLYQLFDEKADPDNKDREWHFGLYDVHYRKKPSAIALHNLTGLLKDPSANAPTFKTTPLNLTVKGLEDAGHVVVMQKASGTYLIALWSEQIFFDHVSAKPKVTEVRPVTLTFVKPVTQVKLYDPLVKDMPSQALESGLTVHLGVPDHPILLEVTL